VKCQIRSLWSAMSFRNQGDLLSRAGKRYGYETENLEMSRRAIYRRERWDLSIVLAPLWGIYILDAVRIGAPWMSRKFWLYGPVDGPLSRNMQILDVLRRSIKPERIATPSQYCAKALAECGIPGVTVIPHGLDPLDFTFPPERIEEGKTNLRERYGDRVFFFSNINPLHRKGLTQMVDAMEILNEDRIPEYAVILHTEKSRALALEPRLNSVGNLFIQDDYRGCPFREMAYKTLISDVILFPSLLEGFGLPVLEGLFASKPIVMADAPAHNELVDPSCAWMAPVREVREEYWKGPSCIARLHLYEPRDLAECMRQAIDNPRERAEKGFKAKEKGLRYHYFNVYKPFFKG